MASKICKIVYFDEDSVTDYVQIVAGGTLEKTTELLNSSDLSEEQKADALWTVRSRKNGKCKKHK